MELDRFDYIILKLLKKKNCNSFFQSMTLQEIMAITQTNRTSTYRKMVKLIEGGYVAKGCKSWNADTFYLTEMSLRLTKQWEDRTK